MAHKTATDNSSGQEKKRRWLSHEISRVEGLSDAVFAFAVTLLVVSLEVPKTFNELAEAMHGFIAFAISFFVLFMVWFYQYRFFRRYSLHDHFTVWLNGLLLFVVLFYVYPLKFLFSTLVKLATGASMEVKLSSGLVENIIDHNQMGVLMIIYGLGFAAVFTVFTLLYLHAYRRRDDLCLNDAEIFDTRTEIQHSSLLGGIGLLSVLIALIGGSKSAGFSGFAYFLIGPAASMHGIMRGKIRRRLFEEPEH